MSTEERDNAAEERDEAGGGPVVHSNQENSSEARIERLAGGKYGVRNIVPPVDRAGGKFCGNPGCDNPHKTRGLCAKHYQQYKKNPTSPFDMPRKNKRMLCSEKGCAGVHYARGVCRDHYNRIPEVVENKRKWTRNTTTPGVLKARTQTKLYKQTPKGRFQVSKGGAQRRGISWDISMDDFIAVSSLPCYYCGKQRPVDYQGSWLDRKFITQGYVKDNVLPCCKDCNMLRGDRMTTDETKAVVHLLKSMRGGGVW